MRYEEELKGSQIVLIMVEKEKYHDSLMQIVSAADSMSGRICYVAINKPASAVQGDLKSSGLNPDKYFFIDTITSTVRTPALDPNCEFVQNPGALTEISMAFTKAASEKGCDNAIFDTISTLAVYQGVSEIVKLIHNLITKARVNNMKSVYIAMKGDNAELIKDLTMFVDAAVEA